MRLQKPNYYNRAKLTHRFAEVEQHIEPLIEEAR